MKSPKRKRSYTLILPLALILLAVVMAAPANTALILVVVALGLAVLIVEVDYKSRRFQYKLHERQYGRIESLISLYHSLSSEKPPLNAIQGYAAAADLLRLLVRLTYENKPKTIVELGSGVSTFVLGQTCQKLGQGRIISLDHHLGYAEVTRQSLSDQGLAEIAEVVHAPLTKQKFGSEEYQWYDLSAMPETDGIDLLIVDGPPGKLGKLARYPALPAFAHKLNDGAIVVLDDSNRRGEKAIAARWRAEFSAFDCEFIPLDKGAFLFRKTKNG